MKKAAGLKCRFLTGVIALVLGLGIFGMGFGMMTLVRGLLILIIRMSLFK